MRPTLAAGLTHELRFTVPVTKTVPHLYPESPEFAAMPEVFATGFMVGFVEWACIQAIAPHLDEGELSLGTHVDLSHLAATPPGMEVVARVRLDEVERPAPALLRRGQRRRRGDLHRAPRALRGGPLPLRDRGVAQGRLTQRSRPGLRAATGSRGRAP